MLTDFGLASLHHLLILALVALLALEMALVRPSLDAATVARLASIDRLYGGVAMALLIVGGLRVFFGLKGADFYLGNPLFWIKIALFIAVALLSVPPTMRFGRWARSALQDKAFSPDDAEVRAVRRFLHLEAGVLALIPIAAAAMARGFGT